MKEMHFIAYEADPNMYPGLLTSWYGTKAAIDQNSSFDLSAIIYTTQMGFLSTTYLVWGWNVFVHNSPEDFYEIKLGKNERTLRDVRVSNSLFGLWRAGEFGFGVDNSE